MKILIVEDEIIPANYLKKTLLQEGYDVLEIEDRGANAILRAKKEKPDVIFMDVMLKDNISGCDAALEISRVHPEIQMIFLTAYSDKEMIEFAVKSKAFAYLLKPYRDKEILATLELAKIKRDTPSTSPEKQETHSTAHLLLVDGYVYHTETQHLHDTYGKEVPCGPKAKKLISFLCQHPGQTMMIEEIIEYLWESPKSQQTLRSLIHRIREHTSQDLIINVNK